MNDKQSRLIFHYEQKEALYTEEEVTKAEVNLDNVIRYILEKLLYEETGNK